MKITTPALSIYLMAGDDTAELAEAGEIVLVGLSGRGDKDVDTVDEIEGGG